MSFIAQQQNIDFIVVGHAEQIERVALAQDVVVKAVHHHDACRVGLPDSTQVVERVRAHVEVGLLQKYGVNRREWTDQDDRVNLLLEQEGCGSTPD